MENNKPFTLMGKQLITPPHKKYSYRTKSYGSDVDETLFGSPARFAHQVETTHLTDGKQWDPPWVTSPTKKGAPLLWTPFDYKGFNGVLAAGNDTGSRPRSKPTTPRSARSANKYRLRSHTPTYVDETLFGPRLKEASFKAPWEENNNSNNSKHLLWSPQLTNMSPTSPRSDTSTERPGSRLGDYDDPYIPPTPRDAPHEEDNNVRTPVIRQRPGSSIKTQNRGKAPRVGGSDSVKLKLDFSQKKDMDKEELIERALQLARSAQEASLAADGNSSRRQAWNRPSSCTERSSRNSARLRSARLSDFMPNDDSLSATGVRVPLSARSESGSRPHSARLRSKSAQRIGSSPQSTGRPSWRP